jgi:hypothetical protein
LFGAKNGKIVGMKSSIVPIDVAIADLLLKIEIIPLIFKISVDRGIESISF